MFMTAFPGTLLGALEYRFVKWVTSRYLRAVFWFAVVKFWEGGREVGIVFWSGGSEHSITVPKGEKAGWERGPGKIVIEVEGIGGGMVG